MVKILYVEDNEDNVYMLGRRLRRHGFVLAAAADGERGLAMAASERPDLILMDLSLPGVDGWEATRRLKEAPETRAIPIAATSSTTAGGISWYLYGSDTRLQHDFAGASGAGAWGYIVGTYDKDAGPNNQRLYLNGSRVAQMSDTQPIDLNSDGWIETTWNNASDAGAFAVAGAEEQEGEDGEPPPISGAGVVCLMG